MTLFGRNFQLRLLPIAVAAISFSGCLADHFGDKRVKKLNRHLGVSVYDAYFGESGTPTFLEISGVNYGPVLGSKKWTCFSDPPPKQLDKKFFLRCSEMNSLVTLDLEGCIFDAANLAFLPPNLKALHLAGPSVNDEMVFVLSSHPSIHSLSLRASKITDSGLKHLSKSNSLRKLDVCGTQIGDTGLQALIECKNLERIIIRDTRITPEGIEAYRSNGGKADVSEGNIVGGVI